MKIEKETYLTYGAVACFLLLAIGQFAGITNGIDGAMDVLAWGLLIAPYALLATSIFSKKPVFGAVGAITGVFVYVLLVVRQASVLSKYTWRFDFSLLILGDAFLCAYFFFLMLVALAKRNEAKYGIAAAVCVGGYLVMAFTLTGYLPFNNCVKSLLWIVGAILSGFAYSTMPKPGRVAAPETQPACNTNSHMNGGKTMTQEDKKKFYEMLMLFSGDCMHDRTRLLHKYPEADVDEAVTKGYLEKVGEDNFGVPIYSITESGKEVWE